MREDALEVVLAHRETDHAGAAVARAKQRDGCFVRIHALRLRVSAEAFPGSGRIGAPAGARDKHVVPATDEVDLGKRFALDAIYC